jgi:hypothetical protein
MRREGMLRNEKRKGWKRKKKKEMEGEEGIKE